MYECLNNECEYNKLENYSCYCTKFEEGERITCNKRIPNFFMSRCTQEELAEESVGIKLEEKILEKQGNLLYTTLAEECNELAQACSKIVRKKFFKENMTNELQNLLEEIQDVELNLYLIKKQLTREKDLQLTEEDIESLLTQWRNCKIERLSKIFLK